MFRKSTKGFRIIATLENTSKCDFSISKASHGEFFVHSYFALIIFDAACGDCMIILSKKKHLLVKQFLPVFRVFINIPRQLTHSCSAMFLKNFHFSFKLSRNLRGHNLFNTLTLCCDHHEGF